MEEAPEGNALAADMGVEVAMLQHLFETLEFAPQYHGEEPGNPESQSRSCSAAELCSAFIEFTRDCFGDDFADVLRDWGITRSEDLGRIVYALIDRGLLEQSETDKQSDFERQFDLDRDVPG